MSMTQEEMLAALEALNDRVNDYVENLQLTDAQSRVFYNRDTEELNAAFESIFEQLVEPIRTTVNNVIDSIKTDMALLDSESFLAVAICISAVYNYSIDTLQAAVRQLGVDAFRANTFVYHYSNMAEA